MIKEVFINDPITFEGQPDGGKTPIIDPYNGCQLCCPYCFQQIDNSWNKDLLVHKNIAELLHVRLQDWPKSETIYLGSKCDPYMQIEERCGLTRKCLEALNDLGINTMITTKSDNGLIFRDIDIISNFKSEMTVLMGISNLNQITKGSKNENIFIANRLYDLGITVWAFITPILPFIMNVDNIIEAINPAIPIFLDKLRISKNTIQAEKMLSYINITHPQFNSQYNDVANNENEDYYTDLMLKYSDNNRITFLF